MRNVRGQSTVEYMLLLVTVVMLASLVAAVLKPLISKGSDSFAKKIEFQLGQGVYHFKVK